MMKRLLLALAIALMGATAAQAQLIGGTVTVTPNASAYTSGQCLGGVLAPAGLIKVRSDGGAIITGVTIVDTSATNAAVDIVVFNTLPSGTYTDHATCTIATADQGAIAGVITSGMFSSITDGSAATGISQAFPAMPVSGGGFNASNPSLPLIATSSSIWFLPIIRATPTYGASKSLIFSFYTAADQIQ